jgi:hypothetical protein
MSVLHVQALVDKLVQRYLVPQLGPEPTGYNMGLINYKDTKLLMTSFLVFNRVYRLEIQSVGIFDRLCELLPSTVTFSLVNSPSPPSLCE